jgi:AraC-like DNA-binding protein
VTLATVTGAGFSLKDKNQGSGETWVPMQRASILAELAPLLQDHGLDAAEILREAGLGSQPLTPDSRLPFAAGLRAINIAAERTRCPHLGLLLGQRFQLSHHGALGELMRTAPTLGRALRDFTAWQGGYSTGAVVYLHRLGEDFALGYGAMGSGSRVLYDLVVALGVRIVDQLTSGAAEPEEVHLSHRQPADRAPYARHFKCPVRFNEQRVGIVLSAAALDTRLPGADHLRYKQLLAGLREKLQSVNPGIAARTRHALRHLLQKGTASMEAVADELAMHPRTLRRHLAKEQTSFEALCDTIRFDMARELLDFTDLPVSEIGTALAYASPSAFTDAFRRWSGLPPIAFRRRNDPLRGATANPQ